MKSEFINQEKNRVEIKVEFEASEFDAEMNKVYNKISERVSIPGFRKGHVPRKTIEMRYGKKAIHDEVLENLLNDHITEIMKDYDIEPLFPPSLKSRGAIVDGQPVSVNLLIEARPEINLPEFENIEVERLISVVDDTMVDDMIYGLRKTLGRFEAVDTPVQDDSIITVEFNMVTLDADGEEISRGKKNEMATLNMQELPAPDFKEPLLGKQTGDFVNVTLKNQVTEENLDSPLTSTRYEMKIVEIGERIMPELNPEFYKQCLGIDCETEEDFKDAVAQKMLNKLQDDAERDAGLRAIDAVANMSGIEVPGSLIYHEMQKIKAFDEKDAKERYKMDLMDLLKLRKMEYKDYENQIISQAWLVVRNSLIIDEIGRKYEIKIEPSDLDEWIKETAEKNNLDQESLKKTYFKDKDSASHLVDRVLSDKAIKLLLSKVIIKDVSELTKPVPETKEPESPEEQGNLEKADS